jgi:RNA polymerase sigma-70 factor (ECF subfamily)
VQPHERSLRSYIRSVFPSLPDIDDLVQESYARLIRAREAGRVSYVKAFLFTTARNAAVDFFRRRKVVSIDGIADLEELSVVEDRPDAAEAANKQQELEMLAAAVRGLLRIELSATVHVPPWILERFWAQHELHPARDAG